MVAHMLHVMQLLLHCPIKLQYQPLIYPIPKVHLHISLNVRSKKKTSISGVFQRKCICCRKARKKVKGDEQP